jgi:hypothetical protein
MEHPKQDTRSRTPASGAERGRPAAPMSPCVASYFRGLHSPEDTTQSRGQMVRGSGFKCRVSGVGFPRSHTSTSMPRDLACIMHRLYPKLRSRTDTHRPDRRGRTGTQTHRCTDHFCKCFLNDSVSRIQCLVQGCNFLLYIRIGGSCTGVRVRVEVQGLLFRSQFCRSPCLQHR